MINPEEREIFVLNLRLEVAQAILKVYEADIKELRLKLDVAESKLRAVGVNGTNVWS